MVFSAPKVGNGGSSTPSNVTLCSPRGIAPDSSHANLFIADTGNNRVVRWPYSAVTGPASAANVVLGQPDFAHTSANTVDATGLSGATAVAINKSVKPNHLWVVDTNNNRVLGYTSAATFATYAAADIVIGQPDFFSGGSNLNSAPSAKTLNAPNAAAVDAAGNLFVADGCNNRVLMYAKPFLSGIKANQAAVVVFGQAKVVTLPPAPASAPQSNPLPPVSSPCRDRYRRRHVPAVGSRD